MGSQSAFSEPGDMGALPAPPPSRGVTSSSNGDCQGICKFDIQQCHMHRVGRQARSGTYQQIHTDKLSLKQSWPTENLAFPGSFCFHVSYLPTFHPVVKYTRFPETLSRLGFFNFSQKSRGGLAAQCLCPGKLKEENAKAESGLSAHGS